MRTLTVYRPKILHNALDNFDHCFESLFDESHFMPAARIFNHQPVADIRVTEKSYVLEMELPGYDEKEIGISVDGNNLSVASKQEETKESSSQPEEGKKEVHETWLLKERRVNSFSRSFRLPENANPEEVTAEFKNGILSIEIQKRPEAQKKTIRINAK